MLNEFLVEHRDEIIARVCKRVVTRRPSTSNDAAIDIGIPLFLDQLGEALQQRGAGTEAISDAATGHAKALLLCGFTVSQVVHGYGDVCQVVTGIAIERDAPISTEEFRTLNLCLDDAIAGAVTEFGRLREESIAEGGSERLGLLANEVRNLAGGALLSFEMLRAGTVPVGGSTGAILGRTLSRLQSLAARSLASLRLESGLAQDRIGIAEVLQGMEIAAIAHAEARGVHLHAESSSQPSIVVGDRELLGAAIDGLVQNAIQFTPLDGHVTVTEKVEGDRVVIHFADECGGLCGVDIESLFAPVEHRHANRGGLGLGLGLGRRGMRAMGGDITVRDVVGKGCVFTIRLPREP